MIIDIDIKESVLTSTESANTNPQRKRSAAWAPIIFLAKAEMKTLLGILQQASTEKKSWGGGRT